MLGNESYSCTWNYCILYSFSICRERWWRFWFEEVVVRTSAHKNSVKLNLSNLYCYKQFWILFYVYVIVRYMQFDRSLILWATVLTNQYILYCKKPRIRVIRLKCDILFRNFFRLQWNFNLWYFKNFLFFLGWPHPLNRNLLKFEKYGRAIDDRNISEI